MIFNNHFDVVFNLCVFFMMMFKVEY